jgi:hypothetical protein
VTDVDFKYFSINGKMLGAGEPIRVKPSQRVLFRIVNASATLHHMDMGFMTMMRYAEQGHDAAKPDFTRGSAPTSSAPRQASGTKSIGRSQKRTIGSPMLDSQAPQRTTGMLTASIVARVRSSAGSSGS